MAAALPGGGRLAEAMALAQRKADRITAFREELTELRRGRRLERCAIGERGFDSLESPVQLTELLRRRSVRVRAKLLDA